MDSSGISARDYYTAAGTSNTELFANRNIVETTFAWYEGSFNLHKCSERSVPVTNLVRCDRGSQNSSGTL